MSNSTVFEKVGFQPNINFDTSFQLWVKNVEARYGKQDAVEAYKTFTYYYNKANGNY